MSTPHVTILIPCYNARPYLRAAVESALAQDYENFSVRVVDDGSTDDSLEVISGLSDPRLSVTRAENRGKPVVFNAAVDQAEGEYLCVLDADDLMPSNRLSVLVQHLEDHPDLAIAFSGHELIINDKRCAPHLRAKTPEECQQDIDAYRMPAHDPTAMYRLSALDGARMCEELRVAQGLDFILQIGERCPVAVVGEALYSYRVHTDSITKQGRFKRSEYVAKAMRRACERRGEPSERLVSDYIERAERGYDGRLASHFIDSAVSLREAGRPLDAIKVGLRSVLTKPTKLYFYKPLICALLPTGLRRRLRRTERRPAAPTVQGVTS